MLSSLDPASAAAQSCRVPCRWSEGPRSLPRPSTHSLHCCVHCSWSLPSPSRPRLPPHSHDAGRRKCQAKATCGLRSGRIARIVCFQVARHRDILHEFTHEFRRTRAILAAGVQRDELLGSAARNNNGGGGGGGGVFGYGEAEGGGASTAEMLRDRNAIGSAAANMDHIILQVSPACHGEHAASLRRGHLLL
jgi:hypothetical protein